MKNVLRITFFLLVMPFTNLYAQNQIFLEDGSTLTYTDLKIKAKAPVATFSVNNESKIIPKKEILAFTNSSGKLFTFHLKSGRKYKIKEKGPLDDTCFKAKIYAYKYFKSKDGGNNPYSDENIKDDASTCYDQQIKKLRTRQTIGIVGGALAFSLALGMLISSLAQVSSL